MPSKNYISPETARTWSDAGSTSDELLDAGGLTSGSTVCGSYHDLGAAPRADRYLVEVVIDGFATTPVVGQTVAVYITESDDGTLFAGEPTTAPGDTTEGSAARAQLVNMTYVGSLVVTTASASVILRKRFITRLTGRYIAPLVYNATDDALASSSETHMVTITPIPVEAQ